jgi:hypothetical protein
VLLYLLRHRPTRPVGGESWKGNLTYIRNEVGTNLSSVFNSIIITNIIPAHAVETHGL